MLFNSYEFILFFLPLTLTGFFVLARVRGAEAALVWLTVASLFFYGWWNPKYLLLLVASIAGNFTVGKLISGARGRGDLIKARLLTGIGVAASLALLAYFKYAAFVVGNWNLAMGSNLPVPSVVLPLAISFYTFQQIAYLVDAYRGKIAEYKPIHYGLFVTFFPQLIAGPIVHHRDILPQFMSREAMRPKLQNLAVGIGIFVVGLFKKVVLADGVAQFATPVFDSAHAGVEPTMLVAWGGALAYTMQLYFDFSGYSDMAIGGARLFGIRLPLNFNSPYKATNISEFWRRWHMTLSQFLRDYVYIPLGGNRLGPVRRYANLMTTMLLGGLWHGAGWTFVAWGGLHGVYLVCHQAWIGLRGRPAEEASSRAAWSSAASWGLTFIAVVVGWVFFRAESFQGAWRILEGMAGLNGIAVPHALAARFGESWSIAERLGVTTFLGGGNAFVTNYVWLLVLLPVALWMPNTQEIFRDFEPALGYRTGGTLASARLLASRSARRRLVWRPTSRWAAVTAAVTALGLLSLSRVSEFLYFQF